MNISEPFIKRPAGTSLLAIGLFALGIVIAHFVWLRPTYVLIALVPVALLCVIAALRAQQAVWLPLGILWCLLGAWCAEMQPQPAPSPADDYQCRPDA